MNKILYKILFGIWYAVSCMPAWWHYMNSYLLSALLYHVVRYRRKMVYRNMKDAYPEKSDKEIRKLERRFYLHFCDILVESVMYFAMSKEEIMRRFKFINSEQVVEYFKQGRTIGAYLGHYANWEWASSDQLWIQGTGLCTQLYHPLENPIFDKLIGYTRERFGSKNIPVNESVRHMMKYRSEGQPILIGFIADQVPFWNNIHYFTDFLNHKDTPVFTGPERLMKKMNMAVFYVDIRQVKRGYYTAEFKLITDEPKKWGEYEITERYTRLMEETINASPAQWLWTHNRWKRTKEEWLERYDPETGKVRLD